MIRIDGNFALEITSDDLGGGQEIFTPDQIMLFSIVEEAGLNLPILKLQVRVSDKDLASALMKPGLVFKIKVGRIEHEMKDQMEFVVVKKKVEPQKQGEGNFGITFHCLLNNIEYLQKQIMKAHSSFDEPYASTIVWSNSMFEVKLDPKIDIPNTDDKMNWIQFNTNKRKFLEDVVWHSYIGEGNPTLTAIRRNKEGVFTSLEKIKSKEDGVITNALQDGGTSFESTSPFSVDATEKKIFPAYYYDLTHNDGFMSFLMGPKKKIVASNQEEGVDDVFEVEAKPLMGERTTYPEGYVDKSEEREFINGNVHINWHKAYLQNWILKGSLSATKAQFKFAQYVDLYCLNNIKAEIKSNQDLRSGDVFAEVQMMSGNWIVEKVELNIINNQFDQVVYCCRETVNISDNPDVKAVTNMIQSLMTAFE